MDRVKDKVAIVTGGASGIGKAAAKLLAEEGMTMLVVTHEMGFARDVSSRIIFMEHGDIIEQGPPKKLMYNPEMKRTGEFLGRIIELHE